MSIKRTLRERKFIKSYIENGGNATQAYMALNPEYKGKNARKLGSTMWTNIDISFDDIMDIAGITDEFLAQKIFEGLNATKTISVIPIKSKEAQENSTDLQEANSRNIEFVDVEDYPTRHKYVDTSLKLKNKFPTEKKDIDLNVKGSLEVNNELLTKLAKLDEKDLRKLAKLSKKANAVKK